MFKFRLMILLVCVFFMRQSVLIADEGNTAEGLFKSPESRDEFAREISLVVGKAWEKWQDNVTVENIAVDGSQGVLSSGDIKGPVLTEAAIMAEFDRGMRSGDYSDCVRAVAQAVSNGMRLWQHGYSNDNIPFPQGANCVYTLTPCHNMPVAIMSGYSDGDRAMTEEELYNYMLYRAPRHEGNILLIFHGAASAISRSFQRWQGSCVISGILAKGGVAPQPSPMGTGPGRVRGAKGSGGRLTGAYFDSDLMYETMCEYMADRRQ